MVEPEDKCKGLKFQPVEYGNDGTAEYYVVRAYLPPEVSEREAREIKASFDRLVSGSEPKEGTPNDGFCSVVHSYSRKCYTIQLNYTIPLGELEEAKTAANFMTVLCNGRDLKELVDQLRGRAKEEWVRRQ